MNVINLFELLYLSYDRLDSGLLHDSVIFVLFEGSNGLVDGIVRVNSKEKVVIWLVHGLDVLDGHFQVLVCSRMEHQGIFTETQLDFDLLFIHRLLVQLPFELLLKNFPLQTLQQRPITHQLGPQLLKIIIQRPLVYIHIFLNYAQILEAMVSRIYFPQYLLYIVFLLLLFLRAKFGVNLVPTVILVQNFEDLDTDLLQHLFNHGWFAYLQTVFRDVPNLYFVHEGPGLVHGLLDVLDVVSLKAYFLGTDLDFDVISFTHFLELFFVKLFVVFFFRFVVKVVFFFWLWPRKINGLLLF